MNANGCDENCSGYCSDGSHEPCAHARAEKAEAAEARAHAAIAANDERHAEAIAAVRKRAEKAEAEVARLRGDLVAIGVAAAHHETIRGMVAETLWGDRAEKGDAS